MTNKKSTSRVPGESKDEAVKQQSGTPSTREARIENTSAISGNSPRPKNQVGFQPTAALGKLDKDTANARLVVTFAAELGALVTWKKLELADGQEVFALVFPTSKWTTNAEGELVIKKGTR